MHPRALRVALGSVLIAGLMVACSPTNSGSDVVVPDDPVTAAPATSEPAPPPDDPGEDPGPSVSLPQLPVGGTGEFVDDSQDLQCAGVSWIVEQDGPGALRKGIRIDLTGGWVDPRFFTLVEDGCQDQGESCHGYTFTAASDSPACYFAVETARPLTQEVDNVSLRVAGTIRCVDVEQWECEAFVRVALEGAGSVQLSAPDLDEPEPEPTPEPEPSPEPEPESSDEPEASEATGG